ncbi:hypothetical protein BGZ67_000997 [Mortierella alpina]|nr:hypothetical protein BGZ67_000997 [Mortierella alpina]
MPPGHPQQQQHIPHEPIVLPPPLNIDDHAHYRQQQLHLSADLRHLGTSPEAKDWLKQKPTRSSAHMIHQYNFHSHQYYQPPGSATVNNICRTMSGTAKVPTLHRINTSTSPISVMDTNASEVSVLTSAASKPRPTSITAAATAIASAELNTGQEDIRQGPPAETRDKKDIPASGSAEVGPRVPTLPVRSTSSRFDGHSDGLYDPEYPIRHFAAWTDEMICSTVHLAMQEYDTMNDRWDASRTTMTV